MHIWEHSVLGYFKFDSFGWCGTVKLPIFGRFSYASNNSKDGTIPLWFHTYEPDMLPSESLVQMALATVANHEKLVNDGLRILWDDFHGRGPDCRIWWSNSIDQIHEILGDRYPRDVLDSPEGMYQLLGEPSFFVHEVGYSYNQPCAVIAFESPIEQEHGIGLLTDGKQIIGCGFAADPCAFPEFETYKD